MVRRPLDSDTAAVSPVIGVILMVAITVVLAAVVFVMVQNMASIPQQPPQVTFKASRTDGTLQVMKVEHGPVDWNQAAVSGCDAPAPGPIEPGQLLTNCSGRVTVSYTVIQVLWYQGDFP